MGLAVGFYSGLVDDRRPLTAFIGLLLGLDTAAIPEDARLLLPVSNHLQDCRREPAYAAGSLVFGYIAGRLADA